MELNNFSPYCVITPFVIIYQEQLDYGKISELSCTLCASKKISTNPTETKLGDTLSVEMHYYSACTYCDAIGEKTHDNFRYRISMS